MWVSKSTPDSGGFTLKVNRNGSSETVEVTADGEGFCSQAGALLLSNLCDRLGLTEALSEALAPTRQRRSAHDDGEILRNLIVTLAQGGEHVSDQAALRDQPDLFGDVASDATAFRAIERVGPVELEGIKAARKVARERAFALGAAPERSILDVDAALLGAHSEKEGAAGNYKGGFGFHPMLCYLEGSDAALDGVLRPGNAGSNTGADQVEAIEAGLEQLPPDAMQGEILVRGDSAACVHAVVDFCREGDIRFSVGHELSGPVREAITEVPDHAWVGAISQGGVPVAEHPTRPREAYVTELTDHLDLSAWPEGSRLICRRERAHPGAQLSLIDTDGWRHQCFLTDQTEEDIAELDRAHRAHAHVEQRIEDAMALGLAKLPFRSFQMNEVWMQLVLAAQDIVGYTKALTLTGDLAKAKPQTLRYRLLHQAGRLARSGRRTRLRLARSWPWATDLVAACKKLDALPLPTG
jgi:Transposase DDE domain group 1